MNTKHEIGDAMPESCDWHVHSMFHPCLNGLYRRNYLCEPLPRTIGDVLATHAVRCRDRRQP